MSEWCEQARKHGKSKHKVSCECGYTKHHLITIAISRKVGKVRTLEEKKKGGYSIQGILLAPRRFTLSVCRRTPHSTKLHKKNTTITNQR